MVNEMIKEVEKILESDIAEPIGAVNTCLLTTKQAADWLGYKPRMLEARRFRGDGPLFIRISARAVRYRLQDLQNWVNTRICSSTSTISDTSS
jgi:hypothetical protein